VRVLSVGAGRREPQPDGAGEIARSKYRGKRRHWPITIFASAASLSAVVGVWWFLASVIVREEILVPTPPAVMHRFVTLTTGNSGDLQFWPNAWISLERVMIGWAIAIVGGVLVGLAMAGNRYIRALLDPLIEFGRPIPPLAYAPLLVIWFGIGELSKVVILVLAAFPVVVIGTVASIRNIDESWRRAALTLGASQMYVMRRVIFRAALPEIFTAMRITSGLCWGTIVAAELIASSSGLGWMILQASRFLDTETVFVGIVAIGALAFLMDRAIRLAEAWIVPWRGKR
jgi:taurine transport system permease protein